jgi:hypothetical protein
MDIRVSHADFFGLIYEELFRLMKSVEVFKMCRLSTIGLTPLRDVDFIEFDLNRGILEFEFDQGFLIEMVLVFGNYSITVFVEDETY